MTDNTLDTKGKPPVSNCHKAPLKVISGKEGTSYWICSKCEQPADPYVEDNRELTSDNTLDKILDEVSIDTGLSVGSLVHDDALKAIKQYIADDRKKMLEGLEKLPNFNLIKHTGSYTLTYDNGWGKPYIYTGESLEDCLKRSKEWRKE